MTEAGKNGVKDSEQLPPGNSSDPHIMEYFTLVARHKRAVIICSFLGALFFFGFTYLMPQVFESQATILPPEKQSGMSGLMSFLSGSAALDMMKAQENPALDLFKNILDSRSADEEVVSDPRINAYLRTFDSSLDGKISMIHDAMTSEPLRNGMMNVTVDLPTHGAPSSQEIDSAKKLSAYVANTFISVLDKFNRERLTTTAHNTRVFVESQYKLRMTQLDSAYGVLQHFQEENKTVALPEQLTSTVTAAAMLSAQLQQNEIQLGVEQRELNPNSLRMEMLKAQIEEAQNALKKFDDGSAGEYSIALRSVPELTRHYANYTREIKLLEQITAYLRQQLEQERINEQRSLPSLQVLDPAIPPLRKSSPHRLAMLLLGFVAGLAVSILYVSVRTYFDIVRNKPEEHTQFSRFRAALVGSSTSSAIVAKNGKLKQGKLDDASQLPTSRLGQ